MIFCGLCALACWPGGKNSDENCRILVRFDGSLHNLYVLQITVWECLALLEKFRGRVSHCDIGRGLLKWGCGCCGGFGFAIGVIGAL